MSKDGPRPVDLKMVLRLAGHPDPRCGTCTRVGKAHECRDLLGDGSIDEDHICKRYVSLESVIFELTTRGDKKNRREDND